MDRAAQLQAQRPPISSTGVLGLLQSNMIDLHKPGSMLHFGPSTATERIGPVCPLFAGDSKRETKWHEPCKD
jgi:hypothetical protein